MKHLLIFGLLTALACLTVSCHDKEQLSECQTKCALEPEAGLCNAAFPKYYYDPVEKKCKMFTWGGCGGVVPFQTLQECESCGCE